MITTPAPLCRRLAILCAVAALGAAGCKTRLLAADEDTDAQGLPRDLATRDGADLTATVARDLAAPLDLAAPDLTPPDLATPDLTLDLKPPLDLRENCGDYTIQTTVVIRAQLLIVQDRSRSMTYGIDGRANPPPGQSKWELVRAAIKQVVSGTTSVDWGLMLFGSATNSCGAPTAPEVPVGPGTAPTIRQILDATSPSTHTPTTAAVRNATAWYLARSNDQPRYMLLATDGQPDCLGGGNNTLDDSPAAIAAVAAAANAGIKVFVAGIGSNTGAEQTLVSMARSGGVPDTTVGQPPYYRVGSTQDLVNVLEKAAIRITTCAYPLVADPPVPDRVTIKGSQGVIPRDPSHTNGWDYSTDGKQIIFYGDACNELQKGVQTSVQAIYGCPGGG